MREKLVSSRAYASCNKGTACGHTVEFYILRMVPLKHPRSTIHLVLDLHRVDLLIQMTQKIILVMRYIFDFLLRIRKHEQL